MSASSSPHRVTIYRGPGGLPETDAAAALVWDVGAPVPWGGLRACVAQLRLRFGDQAVEEALPSDVRWVLSLALRGLASQLDADERAARDAIRGASASELPNSVARRRPFLAAWEAFLRPFLRRGPIVIAIPELGRIDIESLSAVRPLLRAARGHDLRFLIGHDPDVAASAPIDVLVRAAKLRILAMLEVLPGSTVVAHLEARPIPPTTVRDPLDDGLEARAFEALAASAPARGCLFEAMQAALDAHGYDAALRLSYALDTSPDDSPGRRRTLHLTRAVAAHNLAPFARAPWLVEGMVSAFSALLAEERSACARSHFEYRLAMLCGRGRGDVAQALEHADRAVREVTDAKDDPRAPFFEAWARNGRAYALLRAGRPADAARDCEAGIARLAGGTAADVPEVDLRLVQLLLANNRARVAAESGDSSERARWVAETDKYRKAVPVEEQPGYQWLPFTENERDLGTARRHHESQLERARDTLDPDFEAVAAHALGLVEYKLGNAGRARELFSTSLRIWRVLRGFPEDLLTEEFNCAVTAFRAGDLAAARAQFEALRLNPLLAEPSAQAELLGGLALIEASSKDAVAMETRIGDAIALAEEGGDDVALVRTLRSSADARLETGDVMGARSLLARARALLDTASAAGGELAPEDALGVLVSSLDAGEEDSDRLAAAMSAAPPALADSNAWWDLPRLLVHVRRAVARGEPIDAASLLTVAGQRPDCG